MPTLEERAHFLAVMRRQGTSAVQRRMNALLLLDEGRTAERVAEALFMAAETVRAQWRLCKAGGRAGVERLAHSGHVPVLNVAQAAELPAEFSGRVDLTAKAVGGFVAARFVLACTPHAMARLLARLGFAWKRPELVSAKADAAAQRAVLETALLPLMREAEADPAAPLLFVDVTHPACDAHAASGSIRQGERAALRSNHGR